MLAEQILEVGLEGLVQVKKVEKIWVSKGLRQGTWFWMGKEENIEEIDDCSKMYKQLHERWTREREEEEKATQAYKPLINQNTQFLLFYFENYEYNDTLI